LQASYDDGKPMIDAQVVVYAPSEPSKPWLKGKTDAQGKFVFTPDSSLVGNWEVKVRRAGHGDIITIPVGQTLALGQISSAADYTPLQKMLMSLSTVWGFVGTALFFAQKKGNS
jgi:nickel transport protein